MCKGSVHELESTTRERVLTVNGDKGAFPTRFEPSISHRILEIGNKLIHIRHCQALQGITAGESANTSLLAGAGDKSSQ